MLQNRCVRAVLGNFDYSVSSSNLIQKLGWVNINQRYIYFTCIMVFKCLHSMAPQYLSSKMNYIKDLQPYNANSMNLLVPILKFSNEVLLTLAQPFGINSHNVLKILIILTPFNINLKLIYFMVILFVN